MLFITCKVNYLGKEVNNINCFDVNSTHQQHSHRDSSHRNSSSADSSSHNGPQQLTVAFASFVMKCKYCTRP